MVAGDAVVMVQQGVFRTNCMDCLDRTNVVQSMLAKKSLQAQFLVLSPRNGVGRVKGDERA